MIDGVHWLGGHCHGCPLLPVCFIPGHSERPSRPTYYLVLFRALSGLTQLVLDSLVPTYLLYAGSRQDRLWTASFLCSNFLIRFSEVLKRQELPLHNSNPCQILCFGLSFRCWKNLHRDIRHCHPRHLCLGVHSDYLDYNPSKPFEHVNGLRRWYEYAHVQSLFSSLFRKVESLKKGVMSKKRLIESAARICCWTKQIARLWSKSSQESNLPPCWLLLLLNSEVNRRRGVLAKLEIKRFEFLLTLQESLMFFFRPATGYFTLQLSSRSILLVSSSFESWFLVFKGRCMCETLELSSLWNFAWYLTVYIAWTQLTRALSMWWFLWN